MTAPPQTLTVPAAPGISPEGIHSMQGIVKDAPEVTDRSEGSAPAPAPAIPVKKSEALPPTRLSARGIRAIQGDTSEEGQESK